MEDIINRIINIDNRTITIKKHTDQTILIKEKELKEALQNLEIKYAEEGKLEGEKGYKEIIDVGKKEIEQLQRKGEKELKDTEKLYRKKKHNLIEELFQNLFMNEE